ncbi:MAG TPA: MBL fold metallo-hydrolase [Ktedonobacteraceae bacterium]|jgi:glyoxylase-like metal-dependent hydrolase (beta-lactamase superfamily II)|nr:MBL fold metallo-hydrolase [Ktedonobacteraceae bacterium]
MPDGDGVLLVPEMSPDARVRVFRRSFSALEEFEGFEVDAYAIITGRYVVVLDTMLFPDDVAMMLQSLQEELAERQLLCVNSHADWDHVYGNGYFTGAHAAPIIAHEHCRARLQSQEARNELADFQKRYPIFAGVALVPPTITFTQGLAIHDGNLTIQLFPAPGHRPDHIAAWVPELRLLLAFDAVEMPIPSIENAAGAPYMFATLESLIALQPQVVLCSHSKTTSPQLIQDNLSYLREIEQRCHTVIRTHRPDAAELAHPSALINYPFNEVSAAVTAPVDRTFYEQVHEDNIRAIMEWLMG